MFFEAKALGEQLRSSDRFHVQNWSMKEAAPEKLWKEQARSRLQRSDVMLIVCDERTYRAEGVLEEVRIARGLNPPVPIRQTYPGRISRPARLPAGEVPTARWTHEHLERLLDVPRRTAAS